MNLLLWTDEPTDEKWLPLYERLAKGYDDQVAVDAFGATLLNKTFKDLPFIGMAEAAGLGTADYRSLDPVMIAI